MCKASAWTLVGVLVLLAGGTARAEVKIVTDRNQDNATGQFKFSGVPAPSRTDAGTAGRFKVLLGQRDPNGGDVEKLNDGVVPDEADQPAENLFFDAGTEGGWLLADMGSVIEVKQVNSYSWHPGPRGPQVYKLYAADGKADSFKAELAAGDKPEALGWKLIATVDTRPADGEVGGQYGVSISESTGLLGNYRYLLFDISRTEADDTFGNTFFSEIDVVGTSDKVQASSPRGGYEIVIDASETPDLKGWIDTKLKPTLDAWYPKIVEMLPSEGFVAPKRIDIAFRKDMRGVAGTAGTHISCAERWFKDNLDGEAAGAVVHELVHVAQQYRSRRNPGWLVEGVADYIRWFKYEPVSKRPRPNPDRAKYTDSYRTTGAFLEYVAACHDHEFVVKINAAMRAGRYSSDLWQEYTGKTVDELWALYVAALKEGKPKPAAARSGPNTLTAEEEKAGWRLLFDGESLSGWHNFKREGVRPGWQVQDGMLACVDPRNAGDIVTTDKFAWFELTLEYNISEGGNSGIIYHITDEEGAAWATGPEIQLQDNANAHDPQLCGWLYALYQPPDDPKTGKPIDATKPFGQWNQVRVVISPTKCEHYVNGVKYIEYVLGSEDFNTRVAKSKFGGMKRFAKAGSGYIGLQGDHGSVSFRNIKIRPIEPGK
ncbi:MAG TPA: DUF1080 domain-containing protein [Phycisphaerae bacterium]|nr:DUF1080 domain-containing protein [Phycisphaerae bacterium]HRY69146.1 DUF1080 domain-containing protein [Phycisphaerae bacterium]HSA26107.1 DUF1080 domain-containing protein [Phycisphaerae bacterium]